MSRALRPLPSQAMLRRVFDYNPRTGILTRKHQFDVPNRINKIWAGKACGSLADSGHLTVSVRHISYLAHRVIWKLVHNEEPVEIDHKNLDPGDNRIRNLRPAGRTENGSNTRSRKRVTKHLPKGVYPNNAGRKVCAKIRSGNVKYHLGSFDTPEEAHAAYCRAARRMHKKFARFN